MPGRRSAIPPPPANERACPRANVLTRKRYCGGLPANSRENARPLESDIADRNYRSRAPPAGQPAPQAADIYALRVDLVEDGEEVDERACGRWHGSGAPVVGGVGPVPWVGSRWRRSSGSCQRAGVPAGAGQPGHVDFGRPARELVDLELGLHVDGVDALLRHLRRDQPLHLVRKERARSGCHIAGGRREGSGRRDGRKRDEDVAPVTTPVADPRNEGVPYGMVPERVGSVVERAHVLRLPEIELGAGHDGAVAVDADAAVD